MPTIKIPDEKRYWDVSNTGDFYGNIVDTFNINLHTKNGYVIPNAPLVPHTLGIGINNKFLLSNFDGTRRYWSFGYYQYKTPNDWDLSQKFTQDTLSNSPIGALDAVIFDTTGGVNPYDVVVVSTSSNLAKFDRRYSTTSWKNNWWTDTPANGGLGQPFLNSMVNHHPLAVFGKLLLIGDGNLLHTVDTTGTVSYARVVFKDNYVIKWIKTTKDRIFIGLGSIMAEYDPYTENVRIIEFPNGESVGFVYGNSLYIIDEKGFISQWNGYGFDIKAVFPNALEYGDIFSEGNYIQLPHQNGIINNGTRIFILMASGRKVKGGIWCYETETGRLYHHSTILLSNNRFNSIGEVDITGVGGIISLFLEREVFMISAYQASISGIFSNAYYGSDRTIGYFTRGYITTPKIPAKDINAFWKNVVIKYTNKLTRKNYNESEQSSIVVKYRTEEPKYNKYGFIGGGNFVGYWINNTSFRINVWGNPQNFGAEVGDEVFITAGEGAGLSAHITLLSYNSPNMIVTIDEGLDVNVGSSFIPQFYNWKKIGIITDMNKTWRILDIPEVDAKQWIQFKIELRNWAALEQIQVGYQDNLILEK
jgi:hypothetical protein